MFGILGPIRSPRLEFPRVGANCVTAGIFGIVVVVVVVVVVVLVAVVVVFCHRCFVDLDLSCAFCVGWQTWANDWLSVVTGESCLLLLLAFLLLLSFH